jgi:hypothetical protein
MYASLFPVVGILLAGRLARYWLCAIGIDRGAVRDKTRGANNGASLARQYECTLNTGFLAETGEEGERFDRLDHC